eukprot:gene6163-8341_t
MSAPNQGAHRDRAEAIVLSSTPDPCPARLATPRDESPPRAGRHAAPGRHERPRAARPGHRAQRSARAAGPPPPLSRTGQALFFFRYRAGFESVNGRRAAFQSLWLLVRMQHAQEAGTGVVRLVDLRGEVSDASTLRMVVSRAFRDFKPYLGGCKYYNCRHLNEPQCPVLDAVKAGEIARLRHELYGQLLHESAQT